MIKYRSSVIIIAANVSILVTSVHSFFANSFVYSKERIYLAQKYNCFGSAFCNSHPLHQCYKKWKRATLLYSLDDNLSLKRKYYDTIGDIAQEFKSDSRTKAKGIYIHIPYCRRRCSYCDFAIIPIGNHDQNHNRNPQDQSKQKSKTKSFSEFEKLDKSYRTSIINEIDLLLLSLKDRNIEQGRNEKIQVSSIYFGGGTPSLAPLETIKSIIDHILSPDGIFLIQPGAEITIEMDPGTFDCEHLKALKGIGINRISLGVQSFDDKILKEIGRVHREQDIFKSIHFIEQVFGKDANYSLDLISGLPGLTLPLWKETLERALALQPAPNHLSIYDLQIEEGTVFGKRYPDHDDDDDDDDDIHHEQEFLTTAEMTSTVDATSLTKSSITNNSRPPLPSSDDCASMYTYASEYMRSNGFEHYEISSYARIKSNRSRSISTETALRTSDSYRSRHNQIYWKIEGEWYAVGMSATSSINGKRFARPRQLSDYINWVSNQDQLFKQAKSTERNNWEPEWFPNCSGESGSDDREEMLLDTIMTRLRTKEGLDMNWIAAQDDTGELLKCVVSGASLGLDLGLAERIKNEEGGDFLRLVDPEGFLFSNSVISGIFAELP